MELMAALQLGDGSVPKIGRHGVEADRAGDGRGPGPLPLFPSCMPLLDVHYGPETPGIPRHVMDGEALPPHPRLLRSTDFRPPGGLVKIPTSAANPPRGVTGRQPAAAGGW